MKNWRDYVGYQPIALSDPDPNKTDISLHFLTGIENSDGNVRLQILREKFDLSEVVLTDDEVGNTVEELLLSFPIVSCENIVTVERQKLQVAKDTNRGVATTNYNNTWFYKGTSPTDSPIIVCGLEDKYYVFKHPDFEKYGFNVKEVSE